MKPLAKTQPLPQIKSTHRKPTPDRESTLAFMEEVTIHRGRVDQRRLHELAKEIHPAYVGQVFSKELTMAGGGPAVSALVRYHHEPIQAFTGKKMVEPFLPLAGSGMIPLPFKGFLPSISIRDSRFFS